MKENSRASQSRQSTKGGSLPRSRERFSFWKRVLLFRRHTSGSRLENEPVISNGEINALDPNIAAFLRQAVLQLVCTERGLNRNPDLQAEKRTIGGSSARLAVGYAPSHSEQGVPTNAHLPYPDQILLETRNPKWKLIFDLGILMCTVWLWLPLTMLVMCIVRLVSPGPTIYRQQRIGFRGKPFTIFKFRTMHVNAETRTHEEYLEGLMANDVPMTKLDGSDSRLIPGGRFLRATGLDELPQIFNVIRGEMSLVGPRPCTLAEFQRYRPEHRCRVSAPPGITGLWQVKGKNKTTFKEMIAMDIFYAKNMSLFLDLTIILQTIPALVRQSVESPAPQEPSAQFPRQT